MTKKKTKFRKKSKTIKKSKKKIVNKKVKSKSLKNKIFGDEEFVVKVSKTLGQKSLRQ